MAREAIITEAYTRGPMFHLTVKVEEDPGRWQTYCAIVPRSTWDGIELGRAALLDLAKSQIASARRAVVSEKESWGYEGSRVQIAE